ncbi:MAG: amino acid adenylation domain-containing protein [Rubripirellula sp.]
MSSSHLTDLSALRSHFWIDYLNGFATPSPLIPEIPCELPGEQGRTVVRCFINDDSVEELKRLAKDCDIRETVIWESIWCVLLNRYTGSDEIAIGVSNAGHCEELQQKWIPLRVPIEANHSVIDLAQRIENLHSFIGRASSEDSPPQTTSSSWNLSLFESAFRLQRDSVVTNPESETATPSIVVSVFLHEGGCQLEIDADGSRYSTPSLDRMLTHMKTLAEGIAKEPRQLTQSAPILSSAERHNVVCDWNATDADFPETVCLHELFEQNAAQKPDAVALVFREEKVTYRELDQRANQVAQFLIQQGIEHESRVGLCAERSAEMIVGMLGILKAGAAFVPIDPNYPADRLAFMIDDSDVEILLSQKTLKHAFPKMRASVVCLDDQPIFNNQSITKPPNKASATSLAYLIYTSGSTGTPKGIALQHRGVVNNLLDLNLSFDVGPSDRVLAISSLSFDMCVYEVLGTLAAGGGIVMPDPLSAKEPAHWAELILQHGVTVWNSAPQLLEMLLNYVGPRPELHPSKLKVAFLGGDWAPVSLPEKLRRVSPAVKLVVLGGATEASIHSIVYPVGQVNQAWKSIPYGRPMANQKAYILDPKLQLVPIGVPGELHLGGVGLARGYFDREQLTQERFIANPFCESGSERIYKTGDIARWMPDGNIELLGRVDHQIKIRGHRIELGEIESALRAHPEVEDAVVMARDDGTGTKQLVSYIVPSELRMDSRSSNDVDRWRVVYNETYACSSDLAEPSRDYVGWISSFTGEPFSDQEMDEVIDRTAERILKLEPGCAYEIGCGTGLILFRVAPKCTFYEGTDLSSVVLENLSTRIKQSSIENSSVRLVERVAADFEGVERRTFDTVIINSVSQHFPDIDYLIKTIRGAVSILPADGKIFLGDLRCLPLLSTFHASIELAHASGSQLVVDVRKRVERSIQNEKELWIDPQLFEVLRDEIPEIEKVSIQLRRGMFHNEMNQFHYDVTLELAGACSEEIGRDLDWNENDLTLESLRDLLEREKPRKLLLRDIPNARVHSLIKAQKCLANAAETKTISDLSLDKLGLTSGAVDPEDFWQVDRDRKYHIDVQWPSSGRIGCFDGVVHLAEHCPQNLGSAPARDSRSYADEKEAAAILRTNGGSSWPMNKVLAWSDFGNAAKEANKQEQLTPALKAMLERRLPAYMVPSCFVYVDHYPLTPNGKIDRQSLPVPDNERPELQVQMVRPRNALEIFLAEVWKEALGFSEIGVDDNFFDLGGHSLIATQIISRVNDVIPLRVTLRKLFENPSVRAFSEELEKQASATNLDILELANILVEVWQLADHEVEAAIARRVSDA